MGSIIGAVRSWIATILGLAALAAGASVPLAALGYRFDLLDLSQSFGHIRWIGPHLPYAVGAGVLGLLVAFIPKPRLGMVWAFLGTAAAAGALATVLLMREAAGSVPPIHDITTDLANPPQFVAVAALREPGDHPVAFAATYDTQRDVAALHREAYADLEPYITRLAPEPAFDAALAAARAMGWEIVAADRAALRIEATDTSFWFGFKDDVVIRLTAIEDGRTRIDVRSQSRVGQSDLGVNAGRIRDYLARLAIQAGR